jgi:cell volume regulation protein A
MVGMIELATHEDASLIVVVRELAVELGIGTATGLLGALILVPLLHRVRLPSEGLYPLLALSLAGALYGVTGLVNGSGFLAVFITGLFLGDARTPFKREIERFHGSLATLAEVVVFVALGLTVSLGSLGGRTWMEGIALALALALLARPVAVFGTLALASFHRRELAFITWSGLKGAVPILLAAFAVLGGATGAEHVYGIVFVVVLVSVIGQGTLVPFAAAALNIRMRERPSLPWQLSVGLTEEPEAAFELAVAEGSPAEGHLIKELPLGEHSWITLVVRDGAAIRPSGSLRLRAQDRLLVFAETQDRVALSSMFEKAN